jgi:hypothetical protein
MLISRLCMGTIVVLLVAGTARAQDFEQPEADAPGWVMTPGVSFGVTYDDNPSVATHELPAPDDTIMVVSPSLDLTYRARHTSLGLRYNGSLARYRTLDELDSYGQGARMDLQHQVSKRVTLQFRDYFSVSPTTDDLRLTGVPFVRTGTRQNELIGGTTVQATRRLDVTGSYRFQWVEFDRPLVSTDPLLDGGVSHGLTLGAMQAVAPRVKIGGSYAYQRASVGDIAEAFGIQNAQGEIAVQLSPTVSLGAGAGVSHLTLPEGLGSRTGPAARIALQKNTEHATFAVSAMRSFVAAFGVVGSMQSSEVAGSVQLPFARRRGFVRGVVAWHDSEPVIEGELGFTSVWVQTTLGYALQRWLRVEVFYSGSFQDTGVAGGRADRNRVGVQVVTLRPMRIQ